MSTIVLRSVKASSLSFTEMDSNFSNLNTDKLENITAESIGDLSDVVQTGTPADNELLAYDTGTSKWINQTAAEAGLSGLTSFSVTTGAGAETSALSYNNSTGVFTFTPVTTADLVALDDFSVTTAAASGAGSLSYNNTTGVFTFAPVDTSLVLTEVEEDPAPVLGGNLDVNNNSITTTVTNGNIDLSANGTGKIRVGQSITHITTNADLNIDANGTGMINLNGSVHIDDLTSFAETIDTLAGVSGTLSLDATDGPIKYVVPSGAMTINGFSTPISGQTITLLIDNATNSSNYGVTLGAGLLTPAGDGVTVTDSGYDLVTITCVDSVNGVYVVTAINDFQ